MEHPGKEKIGKKCIQQISKAGMHQNQISEHMKSHDKVSIKTRLNYKY